MIEELRPSILWWKFATFTERFLPWRWSQALRHGLYNIGRRLRGFAVVWIGPKGTPSPMNLTRPLTEDELRRRNRRVEFENVETPGRPS